MDRAGPVPTFSFLAHGHIYMPSTILQGCPADALGLIRRDDEGHLAIERLGTFESVLLHEMGEHELRDSLQRLFDAEPNNRILVFAAGATGNASPAQIIQDSTLNNQQVDQGGLAVRSCDCQ